MLSERQSKPFSLTQRDRKIDTVLGAACDNYGACAALLFCLNFQLDLFGFNFFASNRITSFTDSNTSTSLAGAICALACFRALAAGDRSAPVPANLCSPAGDEGVADVGNPRSAGMWQAADPSTSPSTGRAHALACSRGGVVADKARPQSAAGNVLPIEEPRRTASWKRTS
jgi:hypothetical protein